MVCFNFPGMIVSTYVVHTLWVYMISIKCKESLLMLVNAITNSKIVQTQLKANIWTLFKRDKIWHGVNVAKIHENRQRIVTISLQNHTPEVEPGNITYRRDELTVQVLFVCMLPSVIRTRRGFVQQNTTLKQSCRLSIIIHLVYVSFPLAIWML